MALEIRKGPARLTSVESKETAGGTPFQVFCAAVFAVSADFVIDLCWLCLRGFGVYDLGRAVLVETDERFASLLHNLDLAVLCVDPADQLVPKVANVLHFEGPPFSRNTRTHAYLQVFARRNVEKC